MINLKRHSQSLLISLLLFTILFSACAPLPAAPAGQRPAATTGGNEAAAPAASDEEAAVAAPAEAPAAGRDSSAAESSYGVPHPPHATPYQGNQSYAPVTAGVTDDNELWQDYLDYLTRHRYVYAHQRDVSERYLIQVTDGAQLPVHDATVEIYVGDTLVFSGRTDAGGRVGFYPRALAGNRQGQSANDQRSNEYRADEYWANEYRVVATKGFVARSVTFARGQDSTWPIVLTDPAHLDYAQLDLLFLMDATGSMGDEIDKLKASMADIADQIGVLPERPDVRYGLVAYRDQGDAFVTRAYDFTPDLDAFQRTLAALRADGGGDEPEALNEALHRSLNDLHWRTEDTVRLIVLVADAPPHLDYDWEGFSYDTDMIDAVRRGIQIFPVGASNLNEEGEYIFRQLAQFTGGKFVFLTYKDGDNPASGPGTETDHDVENYSVDTLDRLVVRLVREELAKLSSPVTEQGVGTQAQPSPTSTPTPVPQPQPLTCTIDLARNWNDCNRSGLVRTLQQGNGQSLLQITLNPSVHDAGRYDRVRFDITYDRAPQGWSVNIGDSSSNNGDGSDGGDQSNDAEVQILDGDLAIYGNDYTPVRETTDGRRLLRTVTDVVRAGETVALEISNGRLGLNYGGGIEVIDSPYLFALNRQPDREGPVNYDLYAAFNRTIDGERNGSGVSKVLVTLYPSR